MASDLVKSLVKLLRHPLTDNARREAQEAGQKEAGGKPTPPPPAGGPGGGPPAGAPATGAPAPAPGEPGGGAPPGGLPAPPEGGNGDGDPTKVVLNVALKLAVAVIAAVGVAGALTLAGSIFLWERFDQAGLPAEQALGKVPAGELTVYGAEGLIVAALIGLVAVLVAYFIDPKATVTVGTSLLTVAILVGLGTYAAFEFDLGTKWILIGLAIGFLLASACLGIADVTGHQFVPFAAAIIIATGLFNVYLFFANTEEHVPVVPAAVKSNEHEFVGYYVSEGTENIYLGIPDAPDRAILRQIPRDAGTDLAIGHVIDRDVAHEKLKQILAELRSHPAVQRTPPPTRPTPHTGKRQRKLAKCKQLPTRKKRKRCRKNARQLPL